MKRFLPLFALLSLLPSCTSVRTVYDEYGNPVEESQPGQEKDIYQVMDSRFNASFSERRNKDGVPETASSRVSSYQRDIDAARAGGQTTYHTNSYNGFNRTSDIRSQSYAGTGRAPIDRNQAYQTGSSAYSRDLRPDFLNESHGLAHSDYSGPMGRSSMEGRASDAQGRSYATHASQYRAHTPSGYAQSRQSKTPQPAIIDHRDQNNPNVDRTRHLLGRDEQPQ